MSHLFGLRFKGHSAPQRRGRNFSISQTVWSLLVGIWRRKTGEQEPRSSMGHQRLYSRACIPLQGLMKGLNKIIHRKYSTHIDNSIGYHYRVTNRIISLD